MTVIFWIWGILGLLINGASWLTLTGNVGVGTSAYMAAGILLWIGGMVLFGFGAVINAIERRSVDAVRAAAEVDAPHPSGERVDTEVRLADFPDVMGGIRYKINDDDTVTARTPVGERTYSNWDSFLKAQGRW